MWNLAADSDEDYSSDYSIDDIAIQAQLLGRHSQYFRNAAYNNGATIANAGIFVSILAAGIISAPLFFHIMFPTREIFHCRIYCSIPYASKSVTAVHSANDSNVETLKPHFSMHFIRFIDWNKYFPQKEIKLDNDLKPNEDDYFLQEVEIVNQYGTAYTITNVTNFKGKRPGRFINDFTKNLTAILDIEENRCYFMAMQKNLVMQPKELFKTIGRIVSGYKKDVQMNNTRIYNKMFIHKLQDPDLANRSQIIGSECNEMKIYYLTNCEDKCKPDDLKPGVGVEGKYAFFTGNNIIEYDFINFGNIAEIDA